MGSLAHMIGYVVLLPRNTLKDNELKQVIMRDKMVKNDILMGRG